MEILGPLHDAGQAGTLLREALLRGDVSGALGLLPRLDEPHRVELLLGAALQDAREGHASARAWLRADESGAAGDWVALLQRLADGRADDSLDRRAARWVAAGKLPERRASHGRAPTPAEISAILAALETSLPEAGVVGALAAGVDPLQVLDVLRAAPGTDLPLARAVEVYDGGARGAHAGGVAGGGAPRPKNRIVSMGLRPVLLVALAGRVP
jgi:hypothetical protein